MASQIIGLLGKARSGKDTIGSRLGTHHDFTRLAFADALKNLALDIDPIVELEEWQDEYELSNHGVTEYRLSELISLRGWEKAKETYEVRRVLQTLGVAVREHIGEDAWVRKVAEQAARIPGRVVITDVRFENEAAWIEHAGGYLVRVVREGQVTTDTHVSETAMDDRATHFLVSAASGDLGKLHRDAAFVAGALNMEDTLRRVADRATISV